jgi:hypothetical protein
MFLQIAGQYRTFERIDWHSKGSNIQIGITNKTAMTALKSFTRTIRLPFDRVDVQAFVAHLGSVARVNHYYFDTSSNSLVGQEDSQLIKRPTIRASAFSLRPWLLIRSFSDSGQIFQCNARLTSFCLEHDGFADDMILIHLITPLSARQSFQDLVASTVDLVPFVALLWSDALVLENLSLVALMSFPLQLSPSLVTAHLDASLWAGAIVRSRAFLPTLTKQKGVPSRYSGGILLF